jgi:hypothetical protein
MRFLRRILGADEDDEDVEGPAAALEVGLFGGGDSDPAEGDPWRSLLSGPESWVA